MIKIISILARTFYLLNINKWFLFRNGDFVTPQFSYLGGEIYNNQGKKLDQVPADLKAEVTKDNDWVKKSLSLSDKLNQENLLRFI